MVIPDPVAVGRALEDAAALAWARYLARTRRAALAVEVAAEVAGRTHRDEVREGAVALLESHAAFPAIESLCAKLAVRTAGHDHARALGAALGRLRWLPGLAPLLGGPAVRACVTMHGAIAAMMGRAEPGDSARIIEVLLPAAGAVVPALDDAASRARAGRFRRSLLCDLAAALAKCGEPGRAREVADAVAAELGALEVVDGASARGWLAVAAAALGDASRSGDLLRDAERVLEDHFDDDVDDHGIPWFDDVAAARAKADHLARWVHGMPWNPIWPVSRAFAGPVAVFRSHPERAVHDAWRNEIVFRFTAAGLDTEHSSGQLALAMDVIDRARREQPEHAPFELTYLATQAVALDEAAAARLAAWLDDLAPDRHDQAIEAGARALARTGHAELALAHARRLAPTSRARAMLEAALALAGNENTREQGLAAARELLSVPGARPDAWLPLGRALLDDERPVAPPMVLRMIGEREETFTLPEHVMHLVLAFGNGLDGDARITCSDDEAVLLARGVAMGTGRFRRILPPSDTSLYHPGDECYRQHAHARLFLSPLPTA